MAFARSARAGLSLLATALASLALLPLASGGAAAPSGCADLGSQAEAQALFAAQQGSPGKAVGGLDPDRDGIACEGLTGPYAAYATIGYNRDGGFFYGVATMPAASAGEERFPCLYGNRKFPDGPRRLNVYKVQPDGEGKPIFGVLGAEARPESGRLLWKADRRDVTPGVYYVAFEEKIRLSPYGDNPCPGFRSSEVRLPRPLR